ncbi:MAG: putative DNA modification/repair radical SAM protein [Lachnospiraceae bacterium]|nr:putative DNA modification/repair radical SAM protein [Lachnospiraceae bacterium]
MNTQTAFTLEEKLRILTDAAKYDVACTSSGHDRAAVKGAIGTAAAAGICHSFAADGRCISLLKILMTNECVYDCKYCINRRSNDVPRTTFSPEEICSLTMEFYKRNYIEGLFLSSGILISPDHTMELMYETLYLLRFHCHFMGYVHVKCIPGADPVLLEKIGFLADRMSMNIELPTSEGLKKLAPSKKEDRILGAISHIRGGIQGNRSVRLSAYQTTRLKIAPAEDVNYLWANAVKKEALPGADGFWYPSSIHAEDRTWLTKGRRSDFVPAGQSTQMIIGASKETDLDIMSKAELLYRQYDLKRVFYSAFINVTHDSALPEEPEGPPLLREHRLYQADFLLRYYGFSVSELLSEKSPDFHPLIDPKCSWAVLHLEQFPVEVQTASYEMLLRVPGIGPKSAERIVKARRTGYLDYESLKRMGVVLKRAHYFILCRGKQLYHTRIEENFIRNELISMDREKNWREARQENWRQMNLFTDFMQGVVG